MQPSCSLVSRSALQWRLCGIVWVYMRRMGLELVKPCAEPCSGMLGLENEVSKTGFCMLLLFAFKYRSMSNYLIIRIATSSFYKSTVNLLQNLFCINSN